MTSCFWDTNLFIYLLEKNPAYYPTVLQVHRIIRKQQGMILTSVLTLGEILVQPYKLNNLNLVQQYKQIFNSNKIRLIHFSPDVADIFARIRANYSVKPPDAFQLACASACKADYFVTNDASLINFHIPDIGKISLLGDILNELSQTFHDANAKENFNTGVD